MASRRRRISVLNTANGKEWYTYISPLRGAMVVVATVVLFFLLTLIIASHTSILEILPTYRTAAERSRERIIENIIKIDSMERVISDVIIYNENVGLIMEGKTPVARTTLISDSVKLKSTFTPSSHLDAALRAQMEGEGEYNIDNAMSLAHSKGSSINYSAPIEGIITEHFDLREGRYGVRIAATSQTHVSAVEAGLVVMSLWSPESGNMIQILHPDNTISIYKNLSQSLVEKGAAVGRGEIIGYNSKAIDNSAMQLFEFELWSGGKPINPERYIIF